jgi:hypothetical protein
MKRDTRYEERGLVRRIFLALLICCGKDEEENRGRSREINPPAEIFD